MRRGPRIRLRLPAADGFSLLEAIVVATVVGLLGAMIVPVTTGMITRAKAEGSTLAAVTALQSARNRAVAERRNFHLYFDQAAHKIRIERVEPDGSRTVIANLNLENGLTFEKFSALPDTPDLFGNATAVAFGGTAPVMFTSDGTLIDDNGDVVNGSLFLGVPQQKATAQAITFFGPTGLIRTWRWGGSRWLE